MSKFWSKIHFAGPEDKTNCTVVKIWNNNKFIAIHFCLHTESAYRSGVSLSNVNMETPEQSVKPVQS